MQLGKARWLWSRRADPRRSVVELYLREVRGYGGPIPATVGYLAPHGGHGPAMITCYGMPSEPEPGILAFDDEALRGVQITNLLPSGAKVPEGGKISVSEQRPMAVRCTVAARCRHRRHMACHLGPPAVLMAPAMDPTFTFTQTQLHSLMEEASQRGARQALAAIGLGDEHALRDLTELRSLIDAYRAIKRSMLVTFGKAIALAVVSALVAYFWFRH